jgi:hypothetical protein
MNEPTCKPMEEPKVVTFDRDELVIDTVFTGNGSAPTPV